ncbi:M66 family metalloprotease [Sorangium sp. So ce315]|uniref:M66 family metalloprotease n=1 Tax=Sorangium sp. So ce315 TaxID=3133299 RepID=UPI003F5D7DBE
MRSFKRSMMTMTLVCAGAVHLAACGGELAASPGDGGSGGSGAGDVGGGGVGGSGVVGGGGVGGGGEGEGDGDPGPSTFCERWTRGADGELPGFATESECADFERVPTGDAPCSGATNATAAIVSVEMAQTHLIAPTSALFTENDMGQELVRSAKRPQFQLVSHRPALVKVNVTGAGASPEVRVTARRGGEALGSLCLSGPASLPDAVGAEPSFDDSFTVSLPPAWIRPGLELEVRAGDATKEIPASDLAVVGGLRHVVVETAPLLFGDPEPYWVEPRFTKPMAAKLPVQSLVWTRFPVPIEIPDLPLAPDDDAGEPARLLSAPDDAEDWRVIAAVRLLGGAIQEANGQAAETKYYSSISTAAYAGGLGGGDIGGGASYPSFIHHELGHTYDLPHMNELYSRREFPYGPCRDPNGANVGPRWGYDPLAREFLSPVDPADPETPRCDPMGGGKEDDYFSDYSTQMIREHFQDRVYRDDERQATVRWDAASGDFAEEPEHDDGWYWRAAQRDVPVHTIYGTYSRDVAEASTVQAPLHYRGNLVKTMDPTDEAHLDWLREHQVALCYFGCDFVVRATLDDGSTRTVLVRRSAGDAFFWWGVNIPGEGTIRKVELLRRPMNNNNDTRAPEHVRQASAATYLDEAEVVVARSF